MIRHDNFVLLDALDKSDGGPEGWMMTHHGYEPRPRIRSSSHSIRRILDVIRGLDPDPERNRMRAVLLEKDLKPLLTKFRAVANREPILDSGPEMPLLISRLLVRAGDDRTALDLLRRSVLRFPGDLWTNVELANQNDNPAEKIRYFTAVRALEPAMASDLAEALLQEYKYGPKEEALSIFRELSRAEPDNPNNFLRLFRALKASGKNTDARILAKREIGRLNEAVRRAPDDAVAHGRLAVFLLFSEPQDVASLLGEFRAVSRLVPNDPVCHYWLGLLLRRQGNLEGSINEFREAVRLSPANPEYHSVLALALNGTNDYKGEISKLREAIRLVEHQLRAGTSAAGPRGESPDSSLISRLCDKIDGANLAFLAGYSIGSGGGVSRLSLYKSLGSVLAATGDHDGAIAVYRDAIKAVPGDSDLHEGLALVLEKQGKSVEAIAVYREAIKTHPKSVELHEGLAELFERQGKIAETNAELDQVIVLVRAQLQSKEDVSTHRKLGMAYLRRSQRQEAVPQFQRVIELDPKQSDACNAIAWDLATDHNPKLRDGAIAVEFATKACERTGWKNSIYLDTLAAAYAESGNFEAAVTWQTKAIERQPNGKDKEDFRKRLKLFQEKKPFHRASAPY